MALSLDDRLLGEKMDNYCSSDEGEREEEGEEKLQKETPKFIPEPDVKDYPGFSTNVSIIHNTTIKLISKPDKAKKNMCVSSEMSKNIWVGWSEVFSTNFASFTSKYEFM